MSRITDYILEPNVVYTNGAFLIKVKVQDSYKYKKYLVSESMKYTTATGTTFTLTNAVSTNNASILQLEGNTTQNGTPTPTNPIPISTVSGDNEVVVCGKNLFDKTQTPIYTYFTTYTELDNGIRATITNAGNNRYLAIKLNAYQVLGKTVTVSATITPSSTNNGAIRMYWLNGSSLTTNVTGILTETGSVTFTIPSSFPSGSNGISLVFSSNRNGTSHVNDYVDYTNIQLEKGSQATPYEPYNGNSYRVDLGGKNRCYTNYNEWEVGHYNAAGNKETNNGRARLIELIPVKPSTTYYVNTNNSSYKFVLRGYNSTKGFVGSYGAIDNGATITTGQLVHYLGVTIYNPSNDTGTEGTTIINKIENGDIKPFICLNSEQDKTYSSYYNYELCKIGNYVDSIKKSSGKNLFDKANEQWTNAYISGSSATTLSNSAYNRTLYIPCEPNTKYTIQKKVSVTNSRFFIASSVDTPAVRCSYNKCIKCGR